MTTTYVVVASLAPVQYPGEYVFADDTRFGPLPESVMAVAKTHLGSFMRPSDWERWSRVSHGFYRSFEGASDGRQERLRLGESRIDHVRKLALVVEPHIVRETLRFWVDETENVASSPAAFSYPLLKYPSSMDDNYPAWRDDWLEARRDVAVVPRVPVCRDLLAILDEIIRNYHDLEDINQSSIINTCLELLDASFNAVFHNGINAALLCSALEAALLRPKERNLARVAGSRLELALRPAERYNLGAMTAEAVRRLVDYRNDYIHLSRRAPQLPEANDFGDIDIARWLFRRWLLRVVRSNDLLARFGSPSAKEAYLRQLDANPPQRAEEVLELDY